MNEEDQKQTLKALRTCRGQLDGIIGMFEAGRKTMEVSNQILAAQALLKRAHKMLLTTLIEDCVHQAIENTERKQASLDEIKPALDKLLIP